VALIAAFVGAALLVYYVAPARLTGGGGAGGGTGGGGGDTRHGMRSWQSRLGDIALGQGQQGQRDSRTIVDDPLTDDPRAPAVGPAAAHGMSGLGRMNPITAGMRGGAATAAGGNAQTPTVIEVVYEDNCTLADPDCYLVDEQAAAAADAVPPAGPQRAAADTQSATKPSVKIKTPNTNRVPARSRRPPKRTRTPKLTPKAVDEPAGALPGLADNDAPDPLAAAAGGAVTEPVRQEAPPDHSGHEHEHTHDKPAPGAREYAGPSLHHLVVNRYTHCSRCIHIGELGHRHRAAAAAGRDAAAAC
jgi:hypothetical protein